MKKAYQPRQTPPRAVREFTAGGVVYRRSPKGIEILMIQDPKGRWTIPKGHVEEGESLEQTALREVTEETGLHGLKIRDRLDEIHFFYRKEGKLIFMTTEIFLIEATNAYQEKLVPEDWMAGINWFPAKEAVKQVEYRQTEKLFRVALARIAPRPPKSVDPVYRLGLRSVRRHARVSPTGFNRAMARSHKRAHNTINTTTQKSSK